MTTPMLLFLALGVSLLAATHAPVANGRRAARRPAAERQDGIVRALPSLLHGLDSPPPPPAYTGPGYGCKNGQKCCVTTQPGCLLCGRAYNTPSVHWGCAGELWNATGRLPIDWSFAGYMHGEQPIPKLPVVANIQTDFGAKGDNITDDSQAFINAFNSTTLTGGVLYIPPGVYRITRVLDMLNKQLVIRGAGQDQTILYFPRSLSEVVGQTWSNSNGTGASDWAQNGAFINMNGLKKNSKNRGWGTSLASVTTGAKRGDTILQVSNTTRFATNMTVRLVMDANGDGSLFNDINTYGHNAFTTTPRKFNNDVKVMRQTNKVVKVGPTWIRLERPIIFNVSMAWAPKLYKRAPIANSGIEYLTIAFPPTVYPGHQHEAGYNAIYFNQLAHSWVRDVTVHNADSAFYGSRLTACTIQGLRVTADSVRGPYQGHRSIWLARGSDNLVTGFDLQAVNVHDLTVTAYEQSTAFVNGSGRDLNMDHLRVNPYGILWSNIHVGAGSRTFFQVPDSSLGGNHSSSFATFWNIKSVNSLALPTLNDFGPNANFIGLKSRNTTLAGPSWGWVLELPPSIYPQDLLSAMKDTQGSRLGQRSQAPPAAVGPPPPAMASAPSPPISTHSTPPRPRASSPAQPPFTPLPAAPPAVPSPRQFQAQPPPPPPLSIPPFQQTPVRSPSRASSPPSPAPSVPLKQLAPSPTSPAPAPPQSAYTGPGYGCQRGQKCCFGAEAGCPLCTNGYGTPSVHWGCAGELWNATGRLPIDWSFAGYMFGEQPIPNLPVIANIQTDFGAKGDNITDDSQAFVNAFNSTTLKGGVLYIPPGVYRITRVLDLTDKQLVIRGAGQDQTILYFPKSLSEVVGQTWSNSDGTGASDWAQGGAFINMNGFENLSKAAGWGTILASVTATAKRGDTILQVSNTALFDVNMAVRLVMDANGDSSLFDDMNTYAPNTYTTTPSFMNSNTHVARQTNRIVQIGSTWIRLERPIIFNVSLAWNPQLYKHSPGTINTGIEYLAIAFPPTVYPGHLREAGYNAIYFNQLGHSWVRAVTVHNADSAFYGARLTACTIQGLRVMADSVRGPYQGHRSIWLAYGSDNLVTGFDLQAVNVHDLTVTTYEQSTAFVNGSGTDINLDHHSASPYGILWSNIDVGRGSRAFFQVPDGTTFGNHSGSFATFWNIKSITNLTLPPLDDFGPNANFVGFKSRNTTLAGPSWGWVLELPPSIYPQDLLSAMKDTQASRLMLAPRAPPLAPPGGYKSPPPSPPPSLSWSPRQLASPPPPQASPIPTYIGYACNGIQPCCLADTCSNYPACPDTYGTPSAHWGCNGELWDPAGRLANDWSFAGYMAGDKPIPTIPVVANIKTDFGAKGDNFTDDTAAFLNAINSSWVDNGALYIPPGTYRITKVLDIHTKNLVLRGAGQDETKLYFQYSLTDISGNTWSGTGSPLLGDSDYTHGTGLLSFYGWDNKRVRGVDATYLADVIAPARRGDTVLQVSSIAGMGVGMWVRVMLSNPSDGSLIVDMNGGYCECPESSLNTKYVIRHNSRIVALGVGWIRLERPIIANVTLAWTPQIFSVGYTSNHAGVENLTIDFPATPYPGHLKEYGYNAIHFNQLFHSWVRNVTVANSDMAFYSWGSVWCTVENLRVTADTSIRGDYAGHRGIWLSNGSDNLVKNCRLEAKLVHDISVASYEHTSVIVNTTHVDACFDHHKWSPYANLFSNIDVGLGTRVFMSGGNPDWGNHTSSFETFWNLKASKSIPLPPIYNFGPMVNLMGLPINATLPPNTWGWVLETLPKRTPVDLYSSFKKTRSARLPRY